MISKSKQKCVAFLPCRAGSERVKNKNTRKFANINEGLISIKLRQLLMVGEIDEIFLTTNDEIILDYATSLKEARIILDQRPESLCDSSTSTDDLIRYAANSLSDCVVVWTHVTSPFISVNIYRNALDAYSINSETGAFDSLMTVNAAQKFMWYKNAPINYSREKEKWPRTQTLDPIYEVNSGIFIAHASTYQKKCDRIGNHPYLMELPQLTAFDVDWEADWMIAEQLYLNKLAFI